MCVNRFFVDVNSFEYKSWLKDLHDEDIREVGGIVERPQRALNMLFDIYKKSIKG